MSSSSGPAPSAAASPKPWVSLTRLNLWKHDAGESVPLVQARRADRIARSLEFCPEPTAEAQSLQLWACHRTFEERFHCQSVVASESGSVCHERPWAEVFHDLSDARRAELCGPCSVSAATRIVRFDGSAISLGSRKRALPAASASASCLQERVLGLAGRVDDLEDFTGCLLGPSYGRSLARRLTRLEQILQVPADARLEAPRSERPRGLCF